MVPDHALVYENAERAERAAAFLTETDGRRLPFSRWPDDEQEQGIAVAIADVLLLAESTGRPISDHLVKGLRYFRDSVAAELAEADDLAGELVKTRCCGYRVDQVRRWFQPCHECAAQDDWQAPPEPIPGTPEYRAAIERAAVAATETALASLIPSVQLAETDRERLLLGFHSGLEHLQLPLTSAAAMSARGNPTDPPECELTREKQNTEYASTGTSAVVAVFADRWPNKPESSADVGEGDIVDLLTCLLHTTREAGGNPVRAAARAIAHFLNETGVNDPDLGPFGNRERAERGLVSAEVASAVYRGLAFDEVASEELLGDAITDWLHLAARDQDDPTELLERVQDAFEAERSEAGGSDELP